MTPAAAPSARHAGNPVRHSPGRQLRLAVAILVGATVAAYYNSLNVPFVFDDLPGIIDNPTIRQPWPLTHVLMPPRGEGLTVEGRPVLNLTLALNHMFGGTSVRGYHVFNVTVMPSLH